MASLGAALRVDCREAADTFEELAQVDEPLDIESFARIDQARQYRRCHSVVVIPKEFPVFSVMKLFS
jgi:hypothetical protein